MPARELPVQRIGSCVVVTLPTEIDVRNASQVRDTLLGTLNRGAKILIIDMTGTTFCGCAGVHALIRARKRAALQHTELRVAVSAPVIRRLFTVIDLQRTIGIYPTVTAALAEAPPTTPTWSPRSPVPSQLAPRRTRTPAPRT